jgi:hypothetical protein
MIPIPLTRSAMRRLCTAALAAVITYNCVSCGTILYPERRGQPSGRIDLTVVALDGILLLFFFVPGAVAFAVDFATGAIYLPPTYYGQAVPEQFDRREWVRVDVGRDQLDRATIEQVVAKHTGRPVRLEPGTYEVRETYTPDLVRDQPDSANALPAAEITPVAVPPDRQR